MTTYKASRQIEMYEVNDDGISIGGSQRSDKNYWVKISEHRRVVRAHAFAEDCTVRLEEDLRIAHECIDGEINDHKKDNEKYQKKIFQMANSGAALQEELAEMADLLRDADELFESELVRDPDWSEGTNWRDKFKELMGYE